MQKYTRHKHTDGLVEGKTGIIWQVEQFHLSFLLERIKWPKNTLHEI